MVQQQEMRANVDESAAEARRAEDKILRGQLHFIQLYFFTKCMNGPCGGHGSV